MARSTWHRFAAKIIAFSTVILLSSKIVRAEEQPANLAPFAAVSTSYVSPHETVAGINADFDPENSNDKSKGAYGNWPRSGTQWVEYKWDKPIDTAKVDIYWFDDHNGVRLPTACRLLYWDGAKFVPVADAKGLGLKENAWNTTTFRAVQTTQLRLEFDSNGKSSTGILQWKVIDTGKSPHFAPIVHAGPDRDVVLPGMTYLTGSVKGSAGNKGISTVWSASGPGTVTFAAAADLQTTASFSAPGEYVLKLTAKDEQTETTDQLKVTAIAAPPGKCLLNVDTTEWKIDSRLWTDRTRKLICNWIPHCVDKINDPKLPEGGIVNFSEAGNKLAGRAWKQNVGPVFCNAWVHNTVESICWALMVDPQNDPEMIASQKRLQDTLDDWIPKILAAQEPDGYLDTYYTLHGLKHWSNKWDHEGYTSGYFLEAAIAHYQLTRGKDTRMYDAARRLADCWITNVGPGSGSKWYEGHEELERAMVRLGRLVNEVDGPGKGGKYIRMAKYLLDNRDGGAPYDQSQTKVIRQYEAVGHAVRAVYCYSGMAAVATETGDVEYLSAVHSLWDNIVNKKYYITGGIGSGETSEGFGPNYSLPNNAYCESCSGCGELFFQHDLQLAYHDAKYADLYEETIHNALLGDIDLAGNNFTYTNALDTSEARYPWHNCPCCIGNIPRTLLQLPTWMYSKGDDGLYVNLYVGSTFTIPAVAGAGDVQIVQSTDYPWSGDIKLTVNPKSAGKFSIHLRIPNRNVSTLYTSVPAVSNMTSLSVNGTPLDAKIVNGYAVIDRNWSPGDKIELVLPMPVQRVTAVDQIRADRGKIAIRRGPIVFNFESVDQKLDGQLDSSSELTAEWDANLLGGVMVVKGKFADGKPLLAIPNYARCNRGGRSTVWIGKP